MKDTNKYEIHNAWLAQINENKIEPVFCDLTIENGVIRKISPGNYDKFIRKNGKVKPGIYNAGGRVITSPLINFHDHIYSRLAKGLPVMGPQDNFHNVLKNLWWKLDKALDNDMIKVSAQMAAVESIRNGVTYIFDHHASPMSVKNSLTEISNILSDCDLRAVLCYEISDRDGEEITRQAIEETINFINNNISDNTKALVGLHASFTITDDTLKKAEQLVNAFNLGIHIHLCEDKIDRELSIERFNSTPIERLKNYKLLNKRSILSHGIHLNEDDYKLISREGCAIAYNPDSNMNNAVGVPMFKDSPLTIPIIPGTDGMHADIAKSLKQLFLLFRHQKNDFGNAFGWFQKIYFDSLKFVRVYFPDYPSLMVGDRADMIIWDYVPPTPINSENYWGHYIYGILERQVKTVIQKGEFLMKDYQLTGIDENSIALQINEQGRRLFDKIKIIAKQENE